MKRLVIALIVFIVLAVIIYQVPAVNQRLSWRLDSAQSYIRGAVYQYDQPPTPMPTALTTSVNTPLSTAMLSPTSTPSHTPTQLPTDVPTATPTPTPTPLPEFVSLTAPAWEKQDWNNCGPATLSLYLKTFGWQGDQYAISELLKPDRADRNVNVEELVYWVRNRAGWLNADFRVSGDIDLLKNFLAQGLSIMVEKGYYDEVSYWPNDDLWAGHYLLLTGYDDAAQAFIVQDTYRGADRQISYHDLEQGWKAFNYVYIYLYVSHQEEIVQDILGPHWDATYNRQFALDRSRSAVEADPDDAFEWFNLGSNLMYFEQYAESSEAYDTARTIGLPQRMFRYQFGPFISYFHGFRIDELMALTQYALQITDNSEEAHLWRGWGYYRLEDRNAAIEHFRRALEVNPNYYDAQYALDFVQNN